MKANPMVAEHVGMLLHALFQALLQAAAHMVLSAIWVARCVPVGGGLPVLKAANVKFVGWDKVGSGFVSAFVTGDVAAVKAATDAGANAAGRIGEVIAVQVIPRPHEDVSITLPAAASK